MIGIVRRDARRAFSYRTLVVGAIASELVSLILFYYVSRLVNVEPFSRPGDYVAFVVVGLLTLQLAYGVLSAPLTLLVQDLVAGNFERLVVSPLGPVAGVLATMALPFVSALGGSAIAMAFAVVVFDLSLNWATVPLAVPAAVLVALSFAPLGVLLLATGLLVKQASLFANWLVTGLSLVAGLYFPVVLLPDWIRWASEIQPLTPAVELMRHLLIGSPLPGPPLVEAGKLAAFAAVLLPPTVWVLSRAVHMSRRRGTIIEY